MMKKNGTAFKIVVLCALLLGATLLLTALGLPYVRRLADPANQRQIQGWIEERGIWGIVILLGLQILQVVVALLPGEPMELLAGALCGAWGGLALCLCGIVLASGCIFTLSKRYGRRLLTFWFSQETLEKWKWLQYSQSEKTDTVIFLLFLLPGTPKDVLTYVVGVTGIPLRRFLGLSILARVPSVLSSTMIGASVIQGKGETALLLFFATGLLGILGIACKERVLAFCRRHARHSGGPRR